jgi:acyl-CoA synthetase (NDP forming)
MKLRNGKDLWAFFEPESVAIFGSLREGGGLGYGVLRNMLDFGFRGRLYPLNPFCSEVMGMKAYSDVSEVSESIDLAVVITPPPTVPAIIEQCARKGIKGAVIVSENFAEANEDGAELQKQLVDITNQDGIRIAGPNTVGTLNTANGLVTIPYPIGYQKIRKGGIALCSQTGVASAQCQPLGDWAYPVSKMCDVRNKCDVNEVDLLNYLADDVETKVIVMHLEDVKDGHGFMEAAGKAARRKPLVIFKTGRSESGARASASHTGSLAVSDRICEDVLRQVGAIRVNTWQEFWEIPKVFEYQPLPLGNRVAIITHSGGIGVMAIDAATEAGLEIAAFSDATLGKLAKISPRLAKNPIDLGPALSVSDDPINIQGEIMAAAMNDPNVDCGTIIVYGGVMAPIPLIVEMFSRLRQRVTKPLTVWVYGSRLSLTVELRQQLEELGLPTYNDPETAIKALGALVTYANFTSSL